MLDKPAPKEVVWNVDVIPESDNFNSVESKLTDHKEGEDRCEK
jgi:hypothetical protein